jgi:branched-chain amino acid transport system ATP-binding protein
MPPAKRDERMEWLFELFPILKSRQRQTAPTLSGGEQQMLTIAHALMMRPDLLILDKPTLGLAPVILELAVILELLSRTSSPDRPGMCHRRCRHVASRVVGCQNLL